MVHESALTAGRDCRPAMPALVVAWLLLVVVPGSLAQDQPPPNPGDQPNSTKDQVPPTPAEEPSDKSEAEAKREQEEEAILEESIFVDPRAQQAMDNSFEELYRRIPPAGQTLPQVLSMARGESRPDPAVIDRHVKSAARVLTDRANIDAVLKGGQGSDYGRVRNLEAAGHALVDPLRQPSGRRDPGFMREYTAKLLEVAPEMLSNHMLARVQIMIALSRLGEPQALDLFIKVLDDPQQPVVLKQLAAQGITTIASSSSRPMALNDTVRAAEALARFLENPNETFWLARVRALEALGSLRQISTIQQRDQAVMAQLALRILANPDERPTVRAYAAWALGRFDVPANYPPINYSLVAYHMGRLSADLGDAILEAEPIRARALTALLSFQVFPGLGGSPDLRGSGIANSRGLGSHQEYVNKMQTMVKKLAAECVGLTRAAGTQVAAAKSTVNSQLAELKTFLEKNPPPPAPLVPGAPNLAVSTTASGR